MTTRPPLRLGFFTRVLDRAEPGERYRLGLAQIAHAERCGFDSAWVAQHHFHEDEGGLPSPFVFLAQAAARTSRIRLGTGIVTLPLELPVRVAEDASVLDHLAGGRLEIGVGAGGNVSAFRAFELDSAARSELFERNLDILRAAWSGGTLPGGDTLYPANPSLARRIWRASFTAEGARLAGQAGDGLLLSRTQPRAKDAPDATLADIQMPMLDAYYEGLAGAAPRVLGSRSVFVADDRRDAMRYAEIGLAKSRERLAAMGHPAARGPLADVIVAFDVHVGTPADVIASLQADATLARVTDLAVQVHSVDPPHALILRSIELMAEKVAPALGWVREAEIDVRKVA